MGFRLIALLSSMLFSVNTFAQADVPPASEVTASYSDSEYQHQAPANIFEITPGFLIQSETIKFKNTAAKLNNSDVYFGVKAEYGFSDLFSLSGTLQVGTGRTSVEDCPIGSTCRDDTKRNGLVDPTVAANFRFPVGMGVIRTGAGLSFSLEDSKIQSDGDINYASGGVTLAPYLGYEVTFGRNILGAKVAYDLYQNDRKQTDKSSGSTEKYKVKDGRSLNAALFYEFNFPRIVSLGFAAEYFNRAETKTELAGVTTANHNAITGFAVKTYVPLMFNETITLVPAVSVGVLDRDNLVNTDGDTIVNFEVVGRFSF